MKIRKFRKLLSIFGTLMFLFGGLAVAQITTGTISGTVKDNQGAAVPRAEVVVLNEGTGLTRTVETDGAGHYSVPSLNPGSYRVTATHEGFQTEVRNGIVLSVGREAIADLSLSVGSLAQTVSVTAAAPLMESTTASLGSLVDERSIRELPLNGRSYDQLALIQPGVTTASTGQTGGAAFAYGTGARFAVGGQRPTSNSFLLDGTNINDQGNGTPGGAAGTNLGVDTIQEFRILTNGFKAEYGRTSGSIITAVTRSGTNTLHGTAFEYIRNSALDARNFFDTGSSPPPFRRNQFGGVLGGPIKKDKTFFFGGYEGLRQGLGTTQTAIVPTAEARQGSTASCTTNCILPGPVTVNPVMIPYINLWPLPNGPLLGDGTGQFQYSPTVPTNEDNALVRIDHQLTRNNSIFGRYEFDTDSTNALQNLPSLSLDLASRRQYFTLQANSVLSPRAVNNARFAVNRTYSTYDPVISPDAAKLSFIPGQSLGALAIGGASFGNIQRTIAQLGSPSGGAIRSWAFNTFQVGDDFTYLAGKHSLKAGVDIQRIQDNTALGNFVRGQYTFSSFADFLTGTSSQLTANSPLGVLPHWGLRQSLFAVYAQDDYAVNSRLTLNLGLRWETATDPTDTQGQLSFLPSPLAPAMIPSNTLFTIGKKNFEPRFGLAWQVTGDGKTVLRAGAGIYHNEILPYMYALNLFNPPAFGRFTAKNPPFPNGYQILGPGATLATAAYTSVEKTPVSNQFNLSIQQQIFTNTMIEVDYAGARSHHSETERELNTATPTFINGNPADVFYPVGGTRQNPNFASITQLQMNGNSHYDSGTVRLRRQSSKGFQGQVFYTFSKATDENSNVSGSESVRSPQAVLNPYNIPGDWGLADFNEMHHLGFNFSYPLPFRADSRALGIAVNGWTLHGIGEFSSGKPFTARLSGSVSRSLAGVLAERPDLRPGFSNNPTSGVSAGCAGFPAGTPVRTFQHWYDPCAFSLPAAGTYGDLGRNTIVGPGLQNLDLALEKVFEVRESLSVTFRAEMFNVMNHANFGLPSTAALGTNGNASTSAGLITYTDTSSRQLQFGLRVNF
jgi:Carboxypeptidase regulatory-like domain/TonB dependent receptor-like, beta-barrel